VPVQAAIPASQIVQIIPSVLAAGGAALDLIGLILTPSTRPPIGEVLQFPDAKSVGQFFGPSSQEAALASIYFLGFDGSAVKPGSILFTQYPLAAVPAWLQSGNISTLGLAALQALSGSLTIVINGTPVVASSINLSAATSFSNAGQIIATGLGIMGVQDGVVSATIAGTVMTIISITSGQVQVGDVLVGTGITGSPYITSFGTFNGTSGTVNISATETVGSAEPVTLNRPAVQYDSTSGSFFIYSSTTGVASTIAFATGTLAGPLLLTLAGGAQLSQGANVGTPAAIMTNVASVTGNWCSFMTTFEPSDSVKEGFAAWNNGQNNRFLYAMWDTNILDTEPNGPGPAVAAINLAAYSGTALLYSNPQADPVGGQIAAFCMGYVASLDFAQTNGRTSFAFKSQVGLPPQVYNGTIAQTLLSFGMNFYGDYTTANEAFIWAYNGSVSGTWLWLDSYVNQIWLSNQLQLAGMVLLQQVRNFPYNTYGYGLIESAFTDPIVAALNFGAINAGVTLSALQIDEINSSAGINISGIVSQRGWYLQVQDASPQVRQARGSPPCTLWYADGQQIQQIVLSSITLQ
jgi:hypothetical protein